MSNYSLGEKIRQIRKGLKRNQTDFAKMLGYESATAISKFEDNSRTPDKDRLIKIAELGNISIDELLTGKNEEIENGRGGAEAFAEPPRHAAAVLIPSSDSTPSGIDPALQAMADIKDIFDSGDPILIPAIQANLMAFKRALLRERQFAQVLRVNQELKERIAKLEAMYAEFPTLKNLIETLRQENKELRTEVNRLKATYENPDGSDDCLTNTSGNE